MNDTMMQMASCSFDVHVQEIIGSLTVGASCIMLHPQGNLDHQYIMQVMEKRQISYLQSVPAYLNNMLEFNKGFSDNNWSSLRNFDIGGKRRI
jgi:non-ribosomal peptide synthetase component F